MAKVHPINVRALAEFALQRGDLAMAAAERMNEGSRIHRRLQAALGEGFVRCHRSYIVNLCRVRQIRKTDLLLDDGRTVPLARRAWPEVNRAFLALCREEIHEDP